MVLNDNSSNGNLEFEKVPEKEFRALKEAEDFNSYYMKNIQGEYKVIVPEKPAERKPEYAPTEKKSEKKKKKK